MPINQIYSLIVPASGANFTAHTYTEVYASSAAAPTINGTTINMAAGTSLPIKVRSISATANVFLLGEKINTVEDSQTIGGSFTS